MIHKIPNCKTEQNPLFEIYGNGIKPANIGILGNKVSSA